jgi:hypothetical protein
MRHAIAIALLGGLLSIPAQAEVTVRKGQGTPAPTQPVTSNNLEAPVFQSDTRNLEAILDKDETARMTHDVARAKPAAIPVPVGTIVVPARETQAIPDAPPEGLLNSILTSIRVFSIRWRETFDIVFAAALVVYVRKLYINSREQHKILAHSIRSAEYAASAAKRSAEICEILLKYQEKPDEAQHKLDLR